MSKGLGDLELSTNEHDRSELRSPPEHAESLLCPTSPGSDLTIDPSKLDYGSYLARAVPYTSGTSSDGSEESFREKFENLQVLFKQLNKQLKSEKIRKESIDMLSRCLTDERQENTKLKDSEKKLAQVVHTLQTRLAGHGLSTSVDLEPGESSVPGVVKQNAFDSLVRENFSLRNELKSLTEDPSKMEDCAKENHQLSQEVETLRKKMFSSQQEHDHLQRLLSASDDLKLREIAALRQEMVEIRQKGDSKDLLCQSLSDKSHLLQDRLRETGTLCQQLLQRLEQLEAAGSSSRVTVPSATVSPMDASFVKLSLASSANFEDQNLDRSALQVQITGLKKKLMEVVHVNQKWQEYHDKREAEFMSLQGRLEVTEHRLAQVPSPSLLSEQQQSQIDKLVLQYKHQIEAIEDDKEKLNDENRHLRMQMNTLTTDNQKLEQQIKALLHQLQSSPPGGTTSTGTSPGREDQARIHALELQIKVCTEDFESERRDRERAQGKINDLERELRIYKSQYESLQNSAASRIHHRRYGHPQNMNLVQCDFATLDDEPMPQAADPPNLIGRGIYQSNDMDEEGEDDVDTPTIRNHRPSFGLSTDSVPAKPTTQKSSMLQCPQCEQKFERSRHTELLEHMDTCLK